MPKAKQPAEDDKNSIADVAPPGKSAPTATSKPVIVTNRPILRDPMVVNEDAATDDTAAENKPHAKSGEAKVQPPSAPPVPGDKQTSTTEDNKDKTPTKDKASSDPAPTNQPADTVKIEVSTTKTDAKTPNETPDAAKKPDLKPVEKTMPDKPAASDKKADSTDGAPSASDKATDQKSDAEKGSGDTETTDGMKSPDQAQKELDAKTAEQAKHDTAIQKVIDSKQYSLPINAVEKRRTKHFTVLGIVLSLLLVLAWADIALDAHLVHINGIKPLTHFFSN